MMLRGSDRPGTTTLAVAGARLEPFLSALDFLHSESLLFPRRSGCPDPSFSVPSVLRADLPVVLFGTFVTGTLASLRQLACLGLFLAAPGVARPSASASPLDSVSMGSLLPLRSFVCSGPAALSLDFSQPGPFPTLRGAA